MEAATADVISTAVAPIVMVSAGGLLFIGIQTKNLHLADRIRDLTREYRAAGGSSITSMKKALICVLATILVVAVGFYVVVVRPLVSPAAQTFAAEAALATPDLILLAAVNVRQAVFLERWYLGAPAVATGTSRAVRPPAERTILEHLAAARVDMRRDVEHVLYGLYPATEQGVRHALVLVGQFDAPSIEQYVARDLRGTARPDGGRTSYEVRRVDPDRCESVTTWMITVDPLWILISDAAAHATLLPRLTH